VAEPVNVLYCESNVDGTIGGSHYCLLYLVENLDRAAFTPIVRFYEDHALVPRFREAAETIVQPRQPPVSWGARSRGALGAPVRLARRGVNALKALQQFREEVRFLKERRIGIVHLNNSIVRHHDWKLASLIAGVPCVSHERGLPQYSGLSKRLGGRMALLIAMSQWIADHMLAGGVAPHNVVVMYDGVDTTKLEVPRPVAELRRTWEVAPDQPVIGIVGNVRLWKGQDIVMRALVDIAKAFPDVVCFFVGASSTSVHDAAFLADLKRLVAENGLERNVRFTGYQKDTAAFVQMMDVVIHASRDPEPFGMVGLEAMAQRKPLVGSGAGGMTEIIVDGVTGYQFPPGDHDVLAERVTRLLRDRALAASMGERGYARLKEQFTLGQYMEQIHAAYRRLLGRSPSTLHAENLAAAQRGEPVPVGQRSS
jgi:glycosyltransferase involved in cell wall biosynthesis